jgi:diacylglycerol kinase
MIKRYFNRFPHALRGLRYASSQDFGFKTQLYGIAAALVAVFYFIKPLTESELLFLVLSYFLILITELQNSALEVALDHLHPTLHEQVGRSKDMSAAAVLLAGTFLFIVVLTIILARV